MAPWHLGHIAEVARRTPGIAHWLPTQERRHVTAYRTQYGTEPANLVVRFSSTRLDVPVQPWTKLPGTVASYVTTHPAEDAPGVHSCPARHQQGRCGACRACWSPQVRQVAYHKH